MANENYITNDLALAATLHCLGFPLLKVTKDRPRADFLFDQNAQLIETVTKYWAGKLVVEPKNYFQTIKDIKTRLYDAT